MLPHHGVWVTEARCSSDLRVVRIHISFPLYTPPVEGIDYVNFLSDHSAADSDDATQNIPIGDTQSTMPCEEVEG